MTPIDRLAFVIGSPIKHSRSPAMINAAFRALGLDASMQAVEIPPASLVEWITDVRRMQPLGASVTIPHKEAVLALADHASVDARAIGAANCLQFRDGKVIAHNTDAPGFADSLGFTPRNAIVVGAGGAARAVAYALRNSNVTVVSRRLASWTASRTWTDLPTLLPTADLLVDCTSAELQPGGELDVPLEHLPHGATVATLIYHHRTRLLERASALGYSTLDGRGMLVHQGARALTIWTGLSAPIDVMSRALDDSLIRNA